MELGENVGDRVDGGDAEGFVRTERQVQGSRSRLKELRDAEEFVENGERAEILWQGLISASSSSISPFSGQIDFG